MYLLGYIPKDNRLYLGDKELNIVGFSLQLSVLEYQTAVMRKDFDTADQVNHNNTSNGLLLIGASISSCVKGFALRTT